MDLPEEDKTLAQPTRARLFAVLQRLRRSASTEELAREVGLHVNGVRRQLARMQDAGLVERSRSSRGRGRPRDEWSVAADANPGGARPEAYADLSGWLARSISGPSRLRQLQAVGREIGREMAPPASDDLAQSVQDAFAALGFQPQVEIKGEGHLSCTLGNCPYRDSVRENQEAVCTLHKGITQGLLEELDPTARLARFEPQDPDRAGCIVEVTGAERVAALPLRG